MHSFVFISEINGMGQNRLNMMKFSQEAISVLEETLLQLHKEGNPRYYEILINDFRVVPKTNNPVHFESFQNLMDANTEYILINVYQGESRHKDQYVYYIHRPIDPERLGIKPNPKLVSQINHDQALINELEEKLRKAKKTKRKAREYIEELEDKLKEAGISFSRMNSPFLKD